MAALAVVGGVAVALGALLPWVSLFAGLETYRGVIGLNGRLLLAGGAASVLGGLVYLGSPRQSVRWGLGLLGACLFGFTSWLVVQLLVVDREIGSDPFVFGKLGPGLFLCFLGAALVLATLLPGEAAQERRPDTDVAPLLLRDVVVPVVALLSASAGIVHFAVLGDHLRESWLFGAFFVGAAAFQMAWALVLASFGGSRPVYLAGAGANAGIVAVWIVSRTVGLPFGPGTGVPEPVGFPDVFATACETALVGGTLLVLRSQVALSAPLRRATKAAASVLGLALIALILAAVLDAVGARSLLPGI